MYIYIYTYIYIPMYINQIIHQSIEKMMTVGVDISHEPWYSPQTPVNPQQNSRFAWPTSTSNCRYLEKLATNIYRWRIKGISQ